MIIMDIDVGLLIFIILFIIIPLHADESADPAGKA